MRKKIFDQYVVRNYGVLTSDLFIRGFSDPAKVRKILFIPNLYVQAGVISDRWFYGKDFKKLGERLLEKSIKGLSPSDNFDKKLAKVHQEWLIFVNFLLILLRFSDVFAPLFCFWAQYLLGGTSFKRQIDDRLFQIVSQSFKVTLH